MSDFSVEPFCVEHNFLLVIALVFFVCFYFSFSIVFLLVGPQWCDVLVLQTEKEKERTKEMDVLRTDHQGERERGGGMSILFLFFCGKGGTKHSENI